MKITFKTKIAIVSIFMLCAVIMSFYPVVANQYTNYQQIVTAKQYSTLVQTKDFEKQSTQLLKDAQEYNSIYAKGPILDPWLARVDKDNVEYQNYLKQLSVPGAKTMAQIIIPTIGVNLPIYHGSTPEILSKGVGHLYGSALPIGGMGMHSVLTGHTGLSTATLFDKLDQMKKGDTFYINAAGKYFVYKVTDIKVVKPDETTSLRPVPGQDLVTLVTCTPYGINDHRLLVTGSRVPENNYSPAVRKSIKAQEKSPLEQLPWSKWMIGYCVLGLSLLLLWIVWLIKTIKSHKKRNQEK